MSIRWSLNWSGHCTVKSKFDVELTKKDKTVTEASLLATAKKFNATWKDEIDVLNRDCIQSFSNFKCGTRIIQGYFIIFKTF